MPLPRTDRHSWKIHLARLAGPPGDGVVFWRWLAEQLFPDWSGGLAGSSVSLRPSPRSCRSLPFLRSRSLPSRHVRFFLSLSLSSPSSQSCLVSRYVSKPAPGRNSPSAANHATCTSPRDPGTFLRTKRNRRGFCFIKTPVSSKT